MQTVEKPSGVSTAQASAMTVTAETESERPLMQVAQPRRLRTLAMR